MTRRPEKDAHIREIHRRLKRAYGPLEGPRRLDPLEELALTILSQNTNDANRDRAYESMRRRYRTWNALSKARVRDLVAAIRVGGLANTKAPRIIETLREIRAREGGFDLSWMRDASDESVREYLMSLPGVGPKTAACVLAFSLDRAVIPVDTHVHRVATRLGLLPKGATAARAHQVLGALIPARLRLPLHVGLIRHGRAVCRAGRPFCEDCVLQDICPTAPYYLGKRGGAADSLGRSGDSRKGPRNVDNVLRQVRTVIETTDALPAQGSGKTPEIPPPSSPGCETSGPTGGRTGGTLEKTGRTGKRGGGMTLGEATSRA